MAESDPAAIPERLLPNRRGLSSPRLAGALP